MLQNPSFYCIYSVKGIGLSGWHISHVGGHCGYKINWVEFHGTVFVVYGVGISVVWKHRFLLSKSVMELKFTITGLLFQALLIILFSVLVDYSDHALPSHSRKGASGYANVTAEKLPVNDVSVYYPSKIICFTFINCLNRLRVRRIHFFGFVMVEILLLLSEIHFDIFIVNAKASMKTLALLLRQVMQPPDRVEVILRAPVLIRIRTIAGFVEKIIYIKCNSCQWWIGSSEAVVFLKGKDERLGNCPATPPLS